MGLLRCRGCAPPQPLALEIERRFLVAGDGWRPHCLWQQRLQQGYLLAAADGLTLRVRTVETPGGSPEAMLTLKAPPPAGHHAAAALADLGRLEFEYTIPCADAEELLALCGHRLSKCRYGLDLPGGAWVLDVFEAENAPLVVAEVELTRADQPLHLPSWCVQEISGEHALSNAALARHPLAAWSVGEREQRLGGWLGQLLATGPDSLSGSTQQLKPSRQILP